LDEHQSNKVVNENSEKKRQTQTKIYYSDKSESTVEDLMDETPSNYNVPNGRLDGRSLGSAAYLPPASTSDLRKLIPKSQKKKKKRAPPHIFRGEETTVDHTQVDEYAADSRSHSLLHHRGMKIINFA
jgi:hypothetical protein